MKISKKLQQFLHEYEQYFRHVLRPTHDEIKNYLKQLEGSALWNLNTIGSTTVNPSPIKMTLIRIKRPEAIVDKISRRPDEFSDGLSSKSLKKMYEELVHHWDAVKHENTDMLSSENLPEVLAEIGIQCSLKDLYDILKLLSSRGIRTVGDFFAVATPERIKAIRNTYLSSTGHAPGHLEMIAILGAIRGAKTISAEIERINAQIEYSRSWNTLKKELSNTGLHKKEEA